MLTKDAKKRLKQMLAGVIFGIGFVIILQHPELDNSWYWQIPACLLIYYSGWLQARIGPRIHSPISDTGKLTGII